MRSIPNSDSPFHEIHLPSIGYGYGSLQGARAGDRTTRMDPLITTQHVRGVRDDGRLLMPIRDIPRPTRRKEMQLDRRPHFLCLGLHAAASGCHLPQIIFGRELSQDQYHRSLANRVRNPSHLHRNASSQDSKLRAEECPPKPEGLLSLVLPGKAKTKRKAPMKRRRLQTENRKMLR